MKLRILSVARLSFPLASAVAALLAPQANAQSWSGATSGAWLTTTNWTGGVAAGSDTITTDTGIAVFNVAANPTIGIDMNTTAGVYYLGAIDNTNATARIINNSSTTAPGILTLNSATVNSVANTIIRNSTNQLLTLTNGTGSGTMGLALGNATENIIQITGTGGITIGSIISGTDRSLTLQGGGTGRLLLSGVNTYSGGTIIKAGELRIASDAALGNASGSVTLNGGTLRGNSTNPQVGNAGGVNITSARNVIVGASGGTIAVHGNNTFSTSGILSGSGTLTKSPQGGGGGQTITFSNTANTFTGALVIDSSNTVGGTINFASIGDSTGAGNLTSGSGTTATANIFSYTGTPSLTLTNRAIQTDGSSMTLQTSGTGSLTINKNLVANGSASRTLTLGAVTGNNNIFAGSIGNPAGGGTVALAKAGSGNWSLGGANTFSGTTSITAGKILMTNPLALQNSAYVTTGSTGTIGLDVTNGLDAGKLTLGGLSGAVNVATAITGYGGVQELALNPQGTQTNTYTGVIANGAANMSLTKSGTGTQVLSTAVSTYSGDTTITGGTLALSGAATIASSPRIQINSSTTLSVAGISGTTFTLGGSQTLAGNGTVLATGKTVNVEGTLSPGASPGTMTQDGGTMQLAVGGDYNWQILDATAAAGTGSDTTSLINGAILDLSLLSAGNTFNINLWSLSGIGPDVNGDATNFNNALTQSWTLFSTGTAISGFSTDKFTINAGAFNGTSGFSNALGGGAFSVGLADSDTDIVLTFTAVPEPSAALLGGLGLLALLRRRR